jgi:taurine transport system permease protein
MSEKPIVFRGGGFALVPKRGAALIAFVAVLILWEMSSRLRWVSPIFLPSPEAIALAFWDLAQSGLLWRHVGESLYRIVWGWGLGTFLGLAAGFAMGIWSYSRAVGVPFVSALFPIPKISLLPLLILWLGIGEASKVATIALGVFFPTAIAP